MKSSDLIPRRVRTPSHDSLLKGRERTSNRSNTLAASGDEESMVIRTILPAKGSKLATLDSSQVHTVTMRRSFIYGVLLWCAAFSIVSLLYRCVPSGVSERAWRLYLERHSSKVYWPPMIVACSPNNNTRALLHVKSYCYAPWQRLNRRSHPCEDTGEVANLLTTVPVEGYGEMQCLRINQVGQMWGPRKSHYLHLHFDEHDKEMIFFIHDVVTPLDSVQYDIAGADSMLMVGLQRKERRPYGKPGEVRFDSVKNVLPTFGPDQGVHIVLRYHTQYVESWVEEERVESWWEWASKLTSLVLLCEKFFTYAQKIITEYNAALKVKRITILKDDD